MQMQRGITNPKVLLPEGYDIEAVAKKLKEDPGCCSCPVCKASYWSWGTVVQCTVEECGFTFPINWWALYSSGWNDGSRCNRFDVEPSWGMREKSKNPYYSEGFTSRLHADGPSKLEPWKAKDEVDWLAVADVSDISLLLPFDTSFCERCGTKKGGRRERMPYALCVKCESETECRFRCSMLEKKCKAGVVFDDLRKTFSNEVCPCYYQSGVRLGNCQEKKLWTIEEVEEDDRLADESFARFLLSQPLIAKIKKEHKGESWSGVVDCPACKGKLHVGIAAYNGHTRGKCETKDCLNWIE